MNLKDKIRSIPDFPKPGINFKDITTLLADPEAFQYTVDQFVAFAEKQNADLIVGVEARGFVFGSAVAYKLGKPLAIVRKPGKLPSNTVFEEYELEYGKDKLEIHTDAVKEGQQVLLVDDLLATGGTIAATAKLVEKVGGIIAGFAFVIELSFLNGRQKLNNHPVLALVDYDHE